MVISGSEGTIERWLWPWSAAIICEGGGVPETSFFDPLLVLNFSHAGPRVESSQSSESSRSESSSRVSRRVTVG